MDVRTTQVNHLVTQGVKLKAEAVEPPPYRKVAQIPSIAHYKNPRLVPKPMLR